MSDPIRLQYDVPLLPGRVRVDCSDDQTVITLGVPTPRELLKLLEPSLIVVVPLSIVLPLIVYAEFEYHTSFRTKGDLLMIFLVLGYWWLQAVWSLVLLYQSRRSQLHIVISGESITLPWMDRNPTMTLDREEVTEISVGVRHQRFNRHTCALRIDRRVGPSIWVLIGLQPATLLEVVIAMRKTLELDLEN